MDPKKNTVINITITAKQQNGFSDPATHIGSVSREVNGDFASPAEVKRRVLAVLRSAREEYIEAVDALIEQWEAKQEETQED